MDHALRRSRLSARLPDLELDALLVTRTVNARYLTGFSGSNGQLLLAPSDATFFTDPRYEEQARREVPDLRRGVYHGEFAPVFGQACRDLGVHRVGFESAGLTFKTYLELSGADGIELVPVGAEVERMRWAKDAEEIELVERAQAITDEAFERVLPKLVEGITERDVAFDLDHDLRLGGAERVAFDTIVAFGENAAEPHHRPTGRPLARGDVVKLDFGCVVEGYHSDMTRTVALGEPDARIREAYDVVRRAQAAGEAAVRAGVTGGQADESARSVIRLAGHGDHYKHSLGHGVGLEIHEGPTLRRASEEVLPTGAVVTVEPGVYLSGLGGVRIEDMVVVEADGCRPLPTSPKELIVL